MYSHNNPYVAKSNHPADDVSAWDFEEEFLEYLETKGYPLHLLGHREAPDTDSYEQEFLDEMADSWEDAKAEAAYEDMLDEQRYDDEKYWDSL